MDDEIFYTTYENGKITHEVGEGDTYILNLGAKPTALGVLRALTTLGKWVNDAEMMKPSSAIAIMFEMDESGYFDLDVSSDMTSFQIDIWLKAVAAITSAFSIGPEMEFTLRGVLLDLWVFEERIFKGRA